MFMSGKLNKLVDLFIGEVEWAAAGGRDNRRIEAEASAGAGGLGLRYGLFDGSQNELAGGTAAVGGGFMEPAVEIAGEVKGGPDGVRLHDIMVKGAT
jgi:hypothetical protein